MAAVLYPLRESLVSPFYTSLCHSQDALTDLTGDSERLPLEEQHGTWLGHKVLHKQAYKHKHWQTENILNTKTHFHESFI